MSSTELLLDAFGRVRDVVYEAVSNLKTDQLAFRPGPDANSIVWLVWHLTRVQDDHLAGVMGAEQVWAEGGWAPRFGLPEGSLDTGYGHSSEQVAQVQTESAELLTAYYDAVHERTIRYLQAITETDLSRIVDESWDPPVTLAVRLVSVVVDDLMHAGQAQYLRGMVMHG